MERMDEPELRIGQLAQRSGLTATALRYYERVGLLVPAVVDPRSGYRRYAPSQVATARVLASLRRVGMPIETMALVVEHLHDRQTVRDLLQAHVERLEAAARNARAETDRVLRCLDPADAPVEVGAAALAAALRSVRFAVGDGRDVAVLGGIAVRADADGVRVAATDRYRLAVRRLPGATTGSWEVVLPLAAAYEIADILAALDGVAVASLRPVDRDSGGFARRLEVVADGCRLGLELIPGDYPDVGLLAPAVSGGAALDADELAALVAGVDGRPVQGRDVVRLPDSLSGGAGSPEFDREFLLQAVRAVPGERLTLALDGPLAPLSLCPASATGSVDPTAWTVLMPIAPSRATAS